MPGTVNGIGTHYYGKKNLKKEAGVCEHCGRQVELQSYDTWLCACVLFIPVIPLGKKKILDYCPSCTYHRALPFAEWERIKSKAITEGMETMNQNPDDPESAIKMHATLVAFGKQEEARQLAAILTEQFGQNPDVLMYLGACHERAKNNAEADTCFAKALAADPTHKGARRAVGIGCIEQGDLAKAREHLDFLLTPGPDLDGAVAFMLATALQKQGQPEQALALFQVILQSSPAVAQQKPFRQAVLAAEKSLNRAGSILPPYRRSYAKVVGLSLAAAAVLFAALGYNLHLAHNQTLFVINHLPVPATVQFDGQPSAVVGVNMRTPVILAEGRHTAQVQYADAPPEAVAFEISNGFFERYGGKSVFVFNVAGSALVLWEKTTYSTLPNANTQNPYTLHFGTPFIALRDIDYVFRDFPETLRTESRSLTKTRVEIIPGEPAAILATIRSSADRDALYDYAEGHLRARRDDGDLLKQYINLAALHGECDRAASFLEQGLKRRPVEIEWHRMFQEMTTRAGRAETLLPAYQKMLETEPDDSALLYLCGRLCTESHEALQFYDRAIAADKENAYPYLAKAYHLGARGDVVAAIPLCEEAAALRPHDDWIRGTLLDILFLQGDSVRIASLTRAVLADAPLDLSAHQTLIEALVASGDTAEAEQAQTAYEDRVRAAMPQDPHQLGLLSRMALLYQTQAFADMLRQAGELRDPVARARNQFAATMELGRTDEAARILEGAAFLQDGFGELLLALAHAQAGKKPEATAWQQRACAILARGSMEDRAAAASLAAAMEVSLEALDDLTIYMPNKAILLVYLAHRDVARREALLARAHKLMGLREFPHYLLVRTAAALETTPSP